MSVLKTCLLVVTRPLAQVKSNIPTYLKHVQALVSESAYIHIQPDSTPEPTLTLDFKPVPYTSLTQSVITDFYVANTQTCSNVEINVLAGHFANTDCKLNKYDIGKSCDVVLIDKDLIGGNLSALNQSLSTWFCVPENIPVRNVQVPGDSSETNQLNKEKEESRPVDQYGHVVLGGTFDRLHVGHKLLLSQGCCLATHTLTVGVTEGPMNNKKTLPELIEPLETRIREVLRFVEGIKPGLQYNVVGITDAFGPTVTVPDMDLIVLSEETRRGGAMINTEREKKGMKPLQEHVIDLVEDTCRTDNEETKISSSSLRKRLLGTLYRQPQWLLSGGVTARPYVIGLTGGAASGKSAICTRLEKLGATIINCDQLGHQVYVKGSQGYDKVVKAFGNSIVGPDGHVDRKALGSIVFSDKNELQRLNSIMWPEIAQLIKANLTKSKEGGDSVVVLDAAILLEAEWDKLCDEVWATILPTQEAVRRLVERNGLSEEEAEKRLASQMSSADRLQRANVALSTQWEYEYTQKQVEKAWALLQTRISPAASTAGTKSNI